MIRVQGAYSDTLGMYDIKVKIEDVKYFTLDKPTLETLILYRLEQRIEDNGYNTVGATTNWYSKLEEAIGEAIDREMNPHTYGGY